MYVREWKLRRAAQQDARSGVDLGESRLIGELGPRPEVNRANHEHARLLSTLAEHHRVDELREDVERAEDAATRGTSPILYNIGLGVAVAFEVWGAFFVMKAVGVGEYERGPFGGALALALICITAVVAHHTTSRAEREVPAESSGTSAAPRRPLVTVVALVAYSAVVLAVAVVRIMSATDDEAGLGEAVMQAVLMVATTCGPAWVAEWLIRKRAPVAALWKRWRTARRRLRAERGRQENAERAVRRIAREGARWDREAAMRRNQYRTHHRLEEARRRP